MIPTTPKTREKTETNPILTIAAAYNWKAYIPLEEHRWLVLRQLHQKYVVHVFNHLNGGYYSGTYFKTFEDAKAHYDKQLVWMKDEG